MDEAERPTTDGVGNPTLGDVSHTNPYTGTTFGDTQTYERGKTIAADGGRADAVPDRDSTETLADVRHTPPGETEGAQRAYDRGTDRAEGADDPGVANE